MRRIYWAAEAQDAQIVEALLRGHGIGAWSFDTGIVRLDWLKTLAFGGCRVMVSDADEERAHRVVAAYRDGDFALTHEEVEHPCCPYCHGFDTEEDPRPRRMIFLILIFSGPLVVVLSFLLKASSAISLFAVACVTFGIALIFSGIAAWVVKSRFRCTSCGRAWRAPPQQTFREMSRSVDGDRIMPDVAVSPAPATP